MDTHHLQELIDLEEGYWWHVAKRRLVVEILRRHAPPPGLLIEGGIGSGRNLLEFQQLGYSVSGLDIIPEAVERARRVGLSDVRVHDLADPWPLGAESARAVVMLDVLEHLPDPIRTLEYAASVLREDGRLVITVPAYPALYSEWDRLLGHCRRYTRKELRQQACDAGLDTVWDGYWNAFSLPAAVMARKLRRPRGHVNGASFPRLPGWLNRLLICSATAERFAARWIPVPAGLSLVGVYAKRGTYAHDR